MLGLSGVAAVILLVSVHIAAATEIAFRQSSRFILFYILMFEANAGADETRVYERSQSSPMFIIILITWDMSPHKTKKAYAQQKPRKTTSPYLYKSKAIV